MYTYLVEKYHFCFAQVKAFIDIVSMQLTIKMQFYDSVHVLYIYIKDNSMISDGFRRE